MRKKEKINIRQLYLIILEHYFQWLPDRLFVRLLYRFTTGKCLHLKNPQSFSEKLQWLKLYVRNPKFTIMVDKYAVKDYVASILGQEYIIPTLGVWDSFEEIDWNSLPKSFVLKTTHGGGGMGVIICKDKATFDKESASKKLNYSLKTDGYTDYREWPYKNVKRRILAEQYIEPTLESGDLPDYKFFCFNGEPKYCQMISGRGVKMCIDFFDREWNHQPFHEPKNFPFADVIPQKPQNYDEMWHTASRLAQGMPFVRIDFYNVNGRILFGEITFFPTSGMGGFSPEKYDYMLGQMIKLPNQ